jgi:hypothetical protein
VNDIQTRDPTEHEGPAMQTAKPGKPKNWVNGQLCSKSVCFHPEDSSGAQYRSASWNHLFSITIQQNFTQDRLTNTLIKPIFLKRTS